MYMYIYIYVPPSHPLKNKQKAGLTKRKLTYGKMRRKMLITFNEINYNHRNDYSFKLLNKTNTFRDV